MKQQPPSHQLDRRRFVGVVSVFGAFSFLLVPMIVAMVLPMRGASGHVPYVYASHSQEHDAEHDEFLTNASVPVPPIALPDELSPSFQSMFREKYILLYRNLTDWEKGFRHNALPAASYHSVSEAASDVAEKNALMNALNAKLRRLQRDAFQQLSAEDHHGMAFAWRVYNETKADNGNMKPNLRETQQRAERLIANYVLACFYLDWELKVDADE